MFDMKNYVQPIIEIYELDNNDSIMTSLSGELAGDGGGVDFGELPDGPIA